MESDFRVGGWLAQPHLNAMVSPTGEVVHLEPRVMEVLEFLAHHPGEVLPKDSIIQGVWRETFVSDDALSRCILELRRVFGDHSKEPRFIRTIPKRGYCLVAPVAAAKGSAERYQKIKALGEREAGRVFLARDSELRRLVVLRFLGPEKGSDEKSRKWLLREARAAAGLDHPFICKIYGTGTLEGNPFVAMEYVEGETLKLRLASNPPTLEEALHTACEIAEALEAAHARGIVHRDVRPSKIILTKQGHVKVLDFGLARRIVREAGDDSDISTRHTEYPPSDGAVPYMSPEQLRGSPIQSTSDIFSFGLVLYEMVAGVHPFRRANSVFTAAAILHDDPPPLQGGQIPPLLRHIISKALARDAIRRYQSIGDVRTDLQDVLESLRAPSPQEAWARPQRSQQGLHAAPGAGAVRRSPWRGVCLTLGVAAATAIVTMIVVSRISVPERDRPVLEATIPVSPADRLAGWNPRVEKMRASGRPTRGALAFSPDGGQLVFAGASGDETRLYSRFLSAAGARPITGTDGGTAPFFSPDGGRIGFWVGSSLRVVSAEGGESAEVIRVPGMEAPACGADWLSPDEIVFARMRGGLWKVPVGGGTPVAITRLDSSVGEVSHRLPHVLPGGREILFTSLSCLEGCEPRVVVQSLESGRRSTLVKNGSDARYVPGGYLVFARAGKLEACRYDAGSHKVREPVTAVLDDLLHAEGSSGDVSSLAAQFAVSTGGDLAFVPGGCLKPLKHYAALVGRDGSARRLELETQSIARPRVSPDGRLFAFASQRGIWLSGLDGSGFEEFTPERKSTSAVWSPDGSSLTFDFGDPGKAMQIRDRPLRDGASTALVDEESFQVPGAWHPGGRYLVYIRGEAGDDSAWGPEVKTRLWLLDRQTGNHAPLLHSRQSETGPAFSPDREWLAYASGEVGETAIMVLPFPPGDNAPLRASPGQGVAPLWARNSRELYWRDETGCIWAAGFRPGPPPSTERPRRLLDCAWKYLPDLWVQNYDLVQDAPQFLMVEVETEPSPATYIQIVTNWTGELNRRLNRRQDHK